VTEIATEAFRTIGRDDRLQDDVVVPFYLDDRKLRISVVRIDGRLYAFDDLCRCGGASCPLSGGLLIATTLMCQCHGSRFDVTTGAVVNGPATLPLKTYTVREVGGDLQIKSIDIQERS
jgi:nitrite reductase/ring-hydroxylating ferredoxin subunit